MRKIITHDGQFHADEVFSIALIHIVLQEELPIVRTRKLTTEDIDNPEIWVLDVGGKFDERKKNFDHHQNANSMATNMLILNYFRGNEISEDLYNELKFAFNIISDIDLSGQLNFNGFQVNALIKSMNSLDDGFNIALNIAKNYINCCKVSVIKSKDSEKIWTKGKDYGLVKWCEDFPIHWKRYKESPFLLEEEWKKDDLYNCLYKLHSSDSSKFPLIATGKEEFMHNNKFFATYRNVEEAKEAVDLLNATYATK